MLARLGSLRTALAVMTAISALYFALVAFGNVTDFGTNQQFVRHVFAMDTTFGDPDVTWRKITSTGVADAAYVLVIVWEALTALVLIGGLVAWLRGGAHEETARRLSTLGWIMAIALFAGGFITIGGEWFQMWQSTTWNGLQPALQNFVVAAVGLILVQLPGRRA